MQRQLAIAIAVGAGAVSALLHLSTQWSLLGALILTLFTPLPLLMAGLSLGLAGALIAVGAAVAAVLLAGDGLRALIFLVADGAPALFLVRQALLSRAGPDGGVEWYPPGLLLAWLTVYGALVFALLALFMGAGPGSLQAAISDYVDGFREIIAQRSRSDAEGLEGLMATIKAVFPFLGVTWWLIVMIGNAVLAQKLVVRLERQLRPTPDLRATELPRWLTLGAVAATFVALLGSGWLGFVATNVALILFVPFFLTGLAVVHAISAGWPGRAAILFAIYLLFFLFGWPVLVVAGLGVLDQVTGLRHRFGGPGQGNERNE